MKPAIIYSLRDPRNGSVRYIGKSIDIRERLWSHIKDARLGTDDHKARWIRLLESQGTAPTIWPLFAVPREMEWQHAERFFIASARYLGLPLTNCTPGGDGAGDLTLESLARRSRATKASWADERIRASRIAGLEQAFASPVSRERRAQAAAQIFKNPIHRANHLAATRALHADPVKRAALTASLRRWFDNPENRQQRADEMRRLQSRPEIRKKIAATNSTPEMRERKRATALTPEVRAKKAAAMRVYLDDPVWMEKRNAAIRASIERRKAKNEMLVAAT